MMIGSLALPNMRHCPKVGGCNALVSERMLMGCVGPEFPRRILEEEAFIDERVADCTPCFEYTAEPSLGDLREGS